MEPNVARLQCVTRTHVGCRRKVNEDALLARPDLGLWAVADGMGGHEAGEVASALVVDMLGAITPDLMLSARTAAADFALKEANRRLRAMAADNRTMGSTAVVFAADSGLFACLWAGDSRAYLARGEDFTQLTHDHSLVQHLVDSGDLDPKSAAQHPNANIITRAVGAEPELDVDGVEGAILAGDIFLLASDGLTRVMSDAEIQAVLLTGDLERAADHLIEICLQRGAPDNVSLIVLKA
jgi:serine/threonine protein phosphatase PrpC